MVKRASSSSSSSFFSNRSVHSTRGLWRNFRETMLYFHEHVLQMNQSKVFAGLVIIVLNVSGKFANITLSKSMESYLKYTFSRNILVFSMAYMATRDIYIAFGIMGVFVLCVNYLFNEESPYCCLPEQFTDYHTSLTEEKNQITPEQIDDAIRKLATAREQMSTKDTKDTKDTKHTSNNNNNNNNTESPSYSYSNTSLIQ